jgi:membrane protein
VDDRGPPTRKPRNGSGPRGQSLDEPIAAAAARPGVVTRLIVWSKARTDGVTRWAVAARERHASVEIGFRLAHRDKRVAAGVLAGGVAYRLFFWLLSFSLLTTGALGFADGERAEQILLDLGFGPVVASVMSDVSQQSQHARWWLLLVGGLLVLWSGYLGAKALVLVHAAVWGIPPPAVRKPLWASLAFTGSVLAFGASIALVRWVRSESQILGLITALASVVVPFGLWLVASHWLPHRGSGWRGLLPGALVVAVGVHAFYLFTIFFLGPKLASATETYGVVGVFATLLFWLYLVGRLVIGGATLNASIYDRGSAPI